MALVGDLRQTVRELLDDTPSSFQKLTRDEDLTGQIPAGLTTPTVTGFTLAHFPIATKDADGTTTLLIKKNGTVTAPTSADPDRGQFTLAVISTDKVTAAYNWYDFGKGDVDEFIKRSLEKLGFAFPVAFVDGFSVTYDGAVNPESSTPPWTVVGNVTVRTILTDGTRVVLEQSIGAGDSYEYQRNGEAVDNATGNVLEAIIRTTTGGVSGRHDLLIFDGKRAARLGIRPGFLDLVDNGTGGTASITFTQDTTGTYRTISLRVRGDVAEARVDGLLVLSLALTGVTTTNRFSFSGSGQGGLGTTIRYDQVRYGKLLADSRDALLPTPDGLVPVAGHYAAAFGYYQLASRYAKQYNASAGGKTFDKKSISERYMALGEKQEGIGDTKRDDFYKRQGRRLAPASAVTSTPLDPYTPRR